MTKKLTILIIFINLALLCSQYAFASVRATDGQTLADLDKQLQEYTSQNRQLHNNIYSSLALSRIQSVAQAQRLAPVQASFLAPNPVAAVINH